MLRELFVSLRRHRGPAVALAVALIALQAFIAGLAMAGAARMQTAEAGAGFAVICHGNGAPSSDSGSAPNQPKNWHPCCFACTAGAGAALLPEPWDAVGASRQPISSPPRLRTASVLIAPRAVRAGFSQAPPPNRV
jgi:hypothetical protein